MKKVATDRPSRLHYRYGRDGSIARAEQSTSGSFDGLQADLKRMFAQTTSFAGSTSEIC